MKLAIFCILTAALAAQAAPDAELKTGRFTLTIGAEGFTTRIVRAGETIAESTPLAGIGKLERATPHGANALTLEYAGQKGYGPVRVEAKVDEGAAHFTIWRFGEGAKNAPGFRYKLEPSGYWYGGGFQGYRDPQVFPLNQANIKPRLFLADGNTQGTPAWYTTKGVAVWIRTPHDFTYSVNHQSDGLLAVDMPLASALNWDVLIEPDLRAAARRIVTLIGLPKTVPPDEYFRQTIYTTWVEYKTAITQDRTIEYAEGIRKNNLPCGLIEIDDKWEGLYGDTEFDKSKFADPKALVDRLHKMGFKVTLWVHPFVNLDSKTYNDPKLRPLLLADRTGKPGLVRWWNGVAAVWDFTNPKAAVEFRARLLRLQKLYGLDGFKFDGADVHLTPRDAKPMFNITPAEYCDVYNREATAHFVWQETRVGVLSQPYGVVQRLIDKHSIWGLANGLAAIVPEAITVSQRGFAYLMPDMVGGNEYDGDKMDAELLIRWAQASALMPLLQFSKAPWHYGDEAVKLSAEASKLHIRFTPYILELAKGFTKTGDPILRSLVYNEPGDTNTFTISDQFMLGTDVLVAPVLTKGAATRKLYLPQGEWKDLNSGKTEQGGHWIEVPAPLSVLPVFVRAGSAAAKL